MVPECAIAALGCRVHDLVVAVVAIARPRRINAGDFYALGDGVGLADILQALDANVGDDQRQA
ncbi:hypothetical protein D3C81_2254140 [compost metagenome]